MLRPLRWLTLLSLVLATSAQAEIITRPLDWMLDGTRFNNVLLYDNTTQKPRPGLIMVSNWYGINEVAIEKARQIAGKDYVILLVDMYGNGLRPTNDDQAAAAAKTLYANRALMRQRIHHAYQQLKTQAASLPLITTQIGAIGFCFGGSAVLDLARSGAELAAVISFHGLLTTDDPALAKHIKAKVLALNGADDAIVPPEQRLAFEQEMREGGVDWTSVDFGKAVHCFSETDRLGAEGNCRFDTTTNRRAFGLMHQWLDEAFSQP